MHPVAEGTEAWLNYFLALGALPVDVVIQIVLASSDSALGEKKDKRFQFCHRWT